MNPSDINSLVAERDTLVARVAELVAEVDRLTDAMSWSEAKAHEDAANLRAELSTLCAKLTELRHKCADLEENNHRLALDDSKWHTRALEVEARLKLATEALENYPCEEEPRTLRAYRCGNPCCRRCVALAAITAP